MYSQWYTLGGYVAADQRDLNTLPSYAVWEDYLSPIVQEAGRQQALVEALCVNVRNRWWPSIRTDFVDALMPALKPNAETAFFPCCRRAANDDSAVVACSRQLVATSTPTVPAPTSDDGDRNLKP